MKRLSELIHQSKNYIKLLLLSRLMPCVIRIGKMSWRYPVIVSHFLVVWWFAPPPHSKEVVGLLTITRSHLLLPKDMQVELKPDSKFPAVVWPSIIITVRLNKLIKLSSNERKTAIQSLHSSMGLWCMRSYGLRAKCSETSCNSLFFFLGDVGDTFLWCILEKKV